MLEPYEGKVKCTVLRGQGGSNASLLPDQHGLKIRECDLNLRDEVGCLRGFDGGPPTPSVLTAAQRLLDFLDGVLVNPGELPKLPRGYYIEVMGSGREGVCVPWTCESDAVDAQLAFFAADVASGWLEELCATIDPDPAEAIRSACGL